MHLEHVSTLKYFFQVVFADQVFDPCGQLLLLLGYVANLGLHFRINLRDLLTLVVHHRFTKRFVKSVT